MSETLGAHFAVSRPTRSLTSWTTATVRQAILDGRLEPGERLDQDAIGDELGVSRTPIREAIAALESEGLLESKPHRGVFVRVVSRKDIREVFAVRALLEAELARQAALSVPDSVLNRLGCMLNRAQRAYDAGDHVSQFEADRRFHETLRQFTENSLLKEILDQVNNRVNVVRRFAQMRPGPHIEEFAHEHSAILQALKSHDPERAAFLMRRHLENSGVRVQELAEYDEQGGSASVDSR